MNKHHKIDLQKKTKAQTGQVEAYWFENELAGLKKTLFHRITIPLDEFDSGLAYESQPVSTEIAIDWLDLQLPDPNDLGNLHLSSQTCQGMEASVYIGAAHNWCEVEELIIQKQSGNNYFVSGKMLIDFETEGVAKNEYFCFETTVEFLTWSDDSKPSDH